MWYTDGMTAQIVHGLCCSSLLLASCQQERDNAQAMYDLSCHVPICVSHSMRVWQAHACIGGVMLCLIWQCLLSCCWHSAGSVHTLHQFSADAWYGMLTPATPGITTEFTEVNWINLHRVSTSYKLGEIWCTSVWPCICWHLMPAGLASILFIILLLLHCCYCYHLSIIIVTVVFACACVVVQSL